MSKDGTMVHGTEQHAQKNGIFQQKPLNLSRIF